MIFRALRPVLPLLLAVPACAVDGLVETTTTGDDRPSFEEFQAATYQEGFAGGVYVVDGDTPILDDKALQEFYERLYGEGALVVGTAGGVDQRWSDAQKRALTYCVSQASFGARHATVVAAMASAAAAWEAVADVDFVHLAAQDGSCGAATAGVVFDVRAVTGQPYLARAFFPGSPRGSRNVLIDGSAFGAIAPWTLAGVLRHELGHVLGFRHEHTRPEAAACFEDTAWRPLTPYDADSVMHYPQCNGTRQGDLVITARDAQGAAALYGAPATAPPPSTAGVQRTTQFSGAVSAGQFLRAAEPLPVVPGSRLTVTMTGSGDPDLYVRFGAQPTTAEFTCRPYLEGAAEQCDLDVPAGQTAAYLGVRGYTQATYVVDVRYVAPR